MKNLISSLNILSILMIGTSVKAITLPAVISDNMVLQQKSAAKIWGWGNPNEKVFIRPSWNDKLDSTIVDGNGKWQVAVNTPAAGGPYIITIRGYNTIVLRNILIGEVWVCSGQSNMEYSYNSVLPQMKEQFTIAANQNIRLFNIPRTTAEYPQEDCRAQWTICDSNTLKSFSAVAYYFGKRLAADLSVPVGLISASWGGTPAETWTPEEPVVANPLLLEASNKLSPSDQWPIKPGLAYNGMINPIANFEMRGVIWYQGESNTGTAASYLSLFTTMIQSWRKVWEKDFPFYFVQLAPFRYGNKNIGALLREAQSQTLHLNGTGMVVTTDLAEDTLDIHPSNKKDVGLRLAKLALSDTYEKTVSAAKSPMYSTMQLNRGKIIIAFNGVGTGIVSKGKSIKGVFIAGADRQFYPAEATITGKKLIVWSKSVPSPVAVRYAFSNTAVGNLFSKEGMPVAPFRTDTWEVDTSAE